MAGCGRVNLKKFGSESCSVFALQLYTAYLWTTVNDDKHDKMSVVPAISYQFLYNIPFFISDQFSARWSTRSCGRINNIETLIFLWLKFFLFFIYSCSIQNEYVDTTLLTSDYCKTAAEQNNILMLVHNIDWLKSLSFRVVRCWTY